MILKKIKNLGFMNRNFGKKVVHVEMPHIAHKKLLRHVLKYKSKCYIICPDNYEYVNSNFGVQMSPKEFKDFLKRYYTFLKDRGVNLQPHVHLSMFPENLTYEEKDHLITSAYNFFIKELKIHPREIVFGWYAADKEALDIARRLKLKVIPEHLHVYDWWLK